MGVPFQCELSGWRGSVLADLDQETRWPDRAGERLAQHMAQAGRRGPHDEPERRRGRFGQSRLAQQEQWVAGIAGAMMQPARCRQVEAGGHAARLQEHGRNRRARGLVGDPQRIGKLVGLCDEQAGRVDAVRERRVPPAVRVGRRLRESFQPFPPTGQRPAWFRERAGQAPAPKAPPNRRRA